MTDPQVPLEDALERVISAARAHLAAVQAAKGRVDDDDVWQAYVDLNNASFAYDELLLDAYGEVTPWDVEEIDPDREDARFIRGLDGAGGGPADPYPGVISVRQRRDYRVPSVSALLSAATDARQAAANVLADERAEAEGRLDELEIEAAGAGDRMGDLPVDIEPVENVGEAVLELLQAGDGSLSALDVPELEPLDGVVTVTEVADPLDLAALDEQDGAAPFALGPQDRMVGRLDEHAYVDDDEDDEGDDEVDGDGAGRP